MTIISRAQKLLRDHGLDCWLTVTSESRDLMSRYLLGIACRSMHAIIVPASGRPVVLIGKMEAPMIRGFRTVKLKNMKEFRTGLRNYVKEFGGRPRIAVNYANKVFYGGKKSTDFMTHGEYLGLSSLLSHARLVSSYNLQYSLRAVKNSEELRLHRRAAAISEAVMEVAISSLKGSTEQQVAALVKYEIEKRGCSLAFEPIVASGPNSSRPHHSPSGRRIKKRDVVFIDMGAAYRLRCADITRTVYVGSSPPTTVRKTYELVKHAQTKAISMIKPGVAGQQVNKASDSVLKHHSKHILHGAGHPLGITVHDLGPSFSSDRREGRQHLREGMVVTVEPGLYFRNFGVRIEDDVVVTRQGCKLITKSPGTIRCV